MGVRPRVVYQRRIRAAASGSGTPGAPGVSTLLARPVSPAPARSSQSPNGSVSVPGQVSAPARSSAAMSASVIVVPIPACLPGNGAVPVEVAAGRGLGPSAPIWAIVEAGLAGRDQLTGSL